MDIERNVQGSDSYDKILFFGAGMKTEEIDNEFNKLYQQLLDYVNSICDLADTLCRGSPDMRRLALNIAETDGRTLERLVKKECDKRGYPDLIQVP